MEDTMKIFVGFTKKDDDQRIVTGYASTEALDSQGEVVEKEAIANALPAYLGDLDESTGKYRFGNLREMHQLSAVGKTIQAKVDEKGLYISGKVVDDNAWKKVKEGVYAGFSIGGRILKQMKNRIQAIKLSEISLVDRPANPEAVFAMIKVDKMGKAYAVEQNITGSSQEGDGKYQEIMSVSAILDMARQLYCLYQQYLEEQRSVKELEVALESLKNLAMKVLNGENRKKFNQIFDNQVFMKNSMSIPTTPNEEILTAANVLDLAREIRYLLEVFDNTGKSTAKLNTALDALKTLATKILTVSDKKKFEEVLYGINFEELDKARLPIKVAPDLTVTQEAKKNDVPAYINTTWTPGYFEQMRKIMG